MQATASVSRHAATLVSCDINGRLVRGCRSRSDQKHSSRAFAAPRPWRSFRVTRPTRSRVDTRTAAAASGEGMEVRQDDMRVVDFYELLGVPDDADVKTIKRAYYDLVRVLSLPITSFNQLTYFYTLLLSHASSTTLSC